MVTKPNSKPFLIVLKQIPEPISKVVRLHSQTRLVVLRMLVIKTLLQMLPIKDKIFKLTALFIKDLAICKVLSP